MRSNNNEHNNRCEPRFQPAFEHVGWQKMDSSELATGEIIDISQTGLSFRVLTTGARPLMLGDEIFVRYLGHDNRPAQYSVVWEHDGLGSLSVGCTRLTTAAVLPNSRPSFFKLVLGRFHRRDAALLMPTQEEAETVVVGTKVQEAGIHGH